MLFSSIPFLYYFLPWVLVLYYLAPKAYRNAILLLASLVFYGWGEPKYVILMAISIGIGFVSGRLIEANRGRSLSHYVMTISVALCLGLLGYFKYATFLAGNLNTLMGKDVLILNVALPIGISFYTFQIISYIVDVHRGMPAQKNFIALATYISMFPQLIAGPVVRYGDVMDQLTERNHNFDQAAAGIRRFVVGLSKKILLANTLGELCDIFRSSDEKSVLFFWIYAVAYALHVYFDFSGYSDMAIGLGKILGFDFLENFNYPFISSSITEFWRRWHMSLGRWFRDYVYIPLGGNRKSEKRWLFNVMLVWALTGFWHGAAWTYLAWGLYFGVLIVMEKKWISSFAEKNSMTRIVYRSVVILLLLISFVIFGATDLREAATYLTSMFGAGDDPMVSAECLYYMRSYGVILFVAMVGATPLPKKLYSRFEKIAEEEVAFGRVLAACETIALLILVVIATAYLVDGSFNPFLYFRF